MGDINRLNTSWKQPLGGTQIYVHVNDKERAREILHEAELPFIEYSNDHDEDVNSEESEDNSTLKSIGVKFFLLTALLFALCLAVLLVVLLVQRRPPL